MRIAISGAHRVGKSSLVEALADALPGYATVDEPYHLLEEEGHDFGEEPSLDELELQLARSIRELDRDTRDVVFDRCPADLVAYLLTHDDADAFDVDAWRPRVQRAMARLDVVVLVPVEERVPSARADRAWRARVDEQVREILLDDPWGFDVDVVEVSGSLRERTEQVVAHLRTRGV